MIKVNGVSSDKLNMIFSQLPSIPAPVRDFESKKVSGRDGSLTIDRGTYGDIDIVLAGHAENNRSKIIEYFGFRGELSFDNSPLYFWRYRVEEINFEEILDDGELITFNAHLTLSPFKYLYSGKSVITATNSISLNNKYNSIAYPNLKLYGSGDVSVSLDGSQKLLIKDVTDYVEIDTENDVIYRDTLGMDKNSIGSTFGLEANKTSILTFTNATKIEIRPNWREL